MSLVFYFQAAGIIGAVILAAMYLLVGFPLGVRGRFAMAAVLGALWPITLAWLVGAGMVDIYDGLRHGFYWRRDR
jgi:hypothetical protein